ncbi:MAG: hypothetical protein ACRD0L_15385 [Acidimicrobiales bacterium]
MSLLCMALLPPLGLVFAVAAVVLGFLGRARALRGEATNGTSALLAIVIGFIGLVVSGIILGSEGVFVAGHPGQINEIAHCVAHATTQHARSLCQQKFTKLIQGHR